MKKITLVILFSVLFTSCAIRLVDFTVISSKNHAIHFDLDQGKATSGKSMGFMALGTNIKDAMDKALENAGPQYDVLVNGVVRSENYFFFGGYQVEGTAVSSRELISFYGEEGYQKWLDGKTVFNPEQASDKDVFKENTLK